MNKKTFSLLPVTIAVCMAIQGQAFANEDVEVIQVTGIRSSLNEAMDIKKNASSIQDSIVAEDIGKFPDQNVAESLQRITGVSISRTNGEGAKVTVRGFGPEFNLVTLNNRTMATAGFGRDFDFQVLPSELISGADVIKASRANISEGSLGAYISINTARPLNNPGQHFAGSVNGQYNDLAEKLGPKVSSVYSNTFEDDTFGILVGFAHTDVTNKLEGAGSKKWATLTATPAFGNGPFTYEDGREVTAADGNLWYPGRAEYFVKEESRERTSANVTLQWAQSDDVTHTFDYLYTDLSAQVFTSGMQLPVQFKRWEDVIVSENNTILAAKKIASPFDAIFQQTAEQSETFMAGYNVEIFKDQWTISGDISYSEAESNPVNNLFNPRYVNSSVDQSIPGQESGLLLASDYVIFDTRNSDVMQITDSTVDWSDPASVRVHWAGVSNDELKDEVLNAKLDFGYELDSEYIKSVDFGISYSDRTKSRQTNKIASGCWNAEHTFNVCGGKFDLPDELFSIQSGGDFLADVSGEFPRDFVLINDLKGYQDVVGELRGEPDWAIPVLDPTASVKNTEEILSLYTQANFEYESSQFLVSGNLGVRYTSTDVSSSGFGKDRLSIEKLVGDGAVDDANGVFLDIKYTEPGILVKEKSYDHVLPSLNLSFDFFNGFFIKTALADVITRPALGDTGVDRKFTDNRAEDFKTSGGNPDLVPYEATQFDLSFEYYGETSSYAVNFFRKEIDSYISTITQQVDSGVDIDGWGDLIEIVTQKENRVGGSISGVELAGLHYFDYLPGLFSNFGIQANYTYLTSEDKNTEVFDLSGVTQPTSGLEGFSENTFNLIAFYETEEFQARLAYNWRDEFLSARQGVRSNGIPEHVSAYGQFDFSTSYDFNENFTVSAEVINLTDEQSLEYADVRERVTLVQYNGRRFQAGVTVRF